MTPLLALTSPRAQTSQAHRLGTATREEQVLASTGQCTSVKWTQGRPTPQAPSRQVCQVGILLTPPNPARPLRGLANAVSKALAETRDGVHRHLLHDAAGTATALLLVP